LKTTLQVGTAPSIASSSQQPLKGSAKQSQGAAVLDDNTAEEDSKLILQSTELKPSSTLQAIAKGNKKFYKQGANDEEVKRIQQALKTMNFDLTADSDYGPKTKAVIKDFQKKYQPSHKTHKGYKVGAADGIVGKNTLLALDEALIDGWKNKCNLVTGEMLKAVFGHRNSTLEQRNTVANEINYAINFAMLDSHERLAHFLGQCKHESGGEVLISESLVYSVERLKRTFTYYRERPNLAEQHGYTNKNKAAAEAIANTIYDDANRSKYNKLGNDKLGDGWKYRGRGIKQITGKYNYRAFTKYHKSVWGEDIDFVKTPGLILTDAKYSVRAALWFWLSNNVAKKADQGINDKAIEEVTVSINGGKNGLKQRMANTYKIYNSGDFNNVCFNRSQKNTNQSAKTPK